MTDTSRPNPYVGLNYFKKSQGEYFFGREADISIISDNLQTHRLTLFYGPSGVGKSSVLQAGVQNVLEQELAAEGFATHALVHYFNNWRDKPAHDLKRELSARLNLASSDEEDLHSFLKRADETNPSQFYLMLDQFEEYFLYHPNEASHDPASFAYQFAQLCNDHSLDLNILLSLREDGFAQLDYFQSSIPTLFEHYLRLKKLDRAAAERAITEPPKQYEKEYQQTVITEPALVQKVLHEIDANTIAKQQGGVIQRVNSDARDASDAYEAPLLQLIMHRLWQKATPPDRPQGQTIVLSAASLDSSGGAKGLIRQHLDKVLEGLNESERRTCARIFKILVTHSQAKIAHTVDDLAAEAGLAPELIQPLLQGLAGESRVLRVISDEQGQQKFEIYHDTLASAIYEWRSEFDAKEEEVRLAAEKVRQEKEVQARREEKLRQEAEFQKRRNRLQRNLLLLAGAITLVALFFAGYSVQQQKRAQASEQQLAENNNVLENTNQELSQLSQDLEHEQVKLEQALQQAREQTVEAEQQAALAVATRLSVQAVQATASPSATNGYPDTGALLSVEARNLLYEKGGGEDKGNIIFTNRAQSMQALAPIARYLQGHAGSILSIAYSPSGKSFVSASDDNSLIIWDAKSGTPVKRLGEHAAFFWSVAYSPDGKHIVSASDNNSLIIWDAESGMLVKQLRKHDSSVLSVAYSPDGEYLVSASDDNSLIIWDVKSGMPVERFGKHAASVWSVAYSPDGKHIVSGDEEGKLIIWDAKSGEVLMRRLQSNDSSIRSIAYSPDGKHIALGRDDSTLTMLDAESGEIEEILRGHDSSVWKVAYSPDGKRLVSASMDGSLVIWDTEAWQLIKKMQGSGSVWSVAYNPDGESMVSGGQNGIIVWNLESTKFKGHKGSVRSIAYSPDGKHIVSGADDNSLIIWDAQTGKFIREYQGHEDWVRSVAYSPNGKYIVSGADDSSLIIWDAKFGNMVKKLKYDAYVLCVAYSPDGNRIVSGSIDNSLTIWDVESGKLVQKLRGHSNSVLSVAYSPDGNRIVSGSADNSLIIWDAQSGHVIKRLEGHKNSVWSVVYSSDGKYIVSGNDDHDLIIWDAQSGDLIQRLQGHNEPVKAVSYSPDGKYIVSGSNDHSLIIWDAETGKKIRQLQGHTDYVWSVAYSPDGNRIVSGSADKTLIVWDVLRSDAEIACDKAGRNLTVAEWEKYIGDIMPYRKTCEQYDYPPDFADANQ